jgi:hypothetical protein
MSVSWILLVRETVVEITYTNEETPERKRLRDIAEKGI